MARLPLPIDSTLPELLAAVREVGAAVLESPPGSGKTTRVPIALAGEVEGQVWVLEPRRVAARAAAQRVSDELGEAVGGTVGYAMRLDRKASERTRVLYVTEALLTRRLDDFADIGAVVLDEFHERSIHTDVALAWVRMLRRKRPELKLVVMSATLDGEAVARFLGAPRVRSEGRLFPVEHKWFDRKDERPIEQRVAAAVRAVEGNVLAFLPGIGEIERTAQLLGDLDVLPLHGELDGAAQDRALRAAPPGGPRRVVLATNVAETSVTVEGISTVVCTGLVRQAAFDPWSGLGTLDLIPIARDSAAQRAGRAGRLGPGLCFHLYSKADHDARPAQTAAEVRRIDLAATVLALGGQELEWFEAPPAGAWRAAVALLERIGAIEGGARTAIGDAMVRLPLPPRLARVVVEAAGLGVLREGASLVTLFGRKLGGDLVHRALDGEGDPRDRQRIIGLVGGSGRPAADAEAALGKALLAGFPDRVARREGTRVRFADGGSAECEHGKDGYVIVTEVDRVGTRVRARNMTRVLDDWLLDAATVRSTLRWMGERVEVREELCFGELVLDASPGQGDPTAVADLLFAHARPVMHRLVPDWDRGEALLQRVAFLRRRGVALPELDLEVAARAVCEGCRSHNDLGSASLVGGVRKVLGESAALVDKLAPESVRIPGRLRCPIGYDTDDPYIESRMQDFFGLADGPRIAGDCALVLRLLAPNGRPQQVTRDLAGFWQRHYPAIRKELMRKYPRTYWPESPLEAEPRVVRER